MAKPTQAPMVPPKPLMSIAETAEYLGISQSLIHSEIKKGVLKPLCLGDRKLFSAVYLQRLLEQE